MRQYVYISVTARGYISERSLSVILVALLLPVLGPLSSPPTTLELLAGGKPFLLSCADPSWTLPHRCPLALPFPCHIPCPSPFIYCGTTRTDILRNFFLCVGGGVEGSRGSSKGSGLA